MAGCGCNSRPAFDGMSPVYKKALLGVIVLNGLMFAVEMAAGIAGRSQALKADALDFLGDFLTYGLSLAVLGQALVWRARAALLKGITLAALGLWVLGSTAWRSLVLGLPSAEVMGGIGFLALTVNLLSVLLLLRYRNGDANVRSVWVCSRNDALGNLGVMAAAAGVWGTATVWPDLLVATVLGGLFLLSASQIIRQALGELRTINGGAVVIGDR